MPVLTTLTPAISAGYYALGALIWAFLLGLLGDRDSFLPTLGKITIWPISAAVTIGSIIRSLFA